MNAIFQMKRSVVAVFAILGLGLISMGALGAGLYHAVCPALCPFAGALNDWTGDRVWPAAIMAGMILSISFLTAGLVHLRLEQRGVGVLPRRIFYALVLWVGAALTWAVILVAT